MKVSMAITFSGKITDMDTKRPIDSAYISLYMQGVETQVSAISDKNGLYTLALPDEWLEGEYSIKIVQENYYTLTGIVLAKNLSVRNFMLKQIQQQKTEVSMLPARIDTQKVMPTSNLVFLIDVSASMQYENKMDMLKVSLKHLASLLRSSDRVSIVTYSNYATLYLKTTPGDHTVRINRAIDSLKCFGKTMGGLGLDKAYKVAAKNYIKGQNNKVILVTDGKFTSTDPKDNRSMDKLIRKMYKKKIALTVFSFGKISPKTEENLIKMSKNGGGTYAHIEDEATAIEEMLDEAKNLGVFE